MHCESGSSIPCTLAPARASGICVLEGGVVNAGIFAIGLFSKPDWSHVWSPWCVRGVTHLCHVNSNQDFGKTTNFGTLANQKRKGATGKTATTVCSVSEAAFLFSSSFPFLLCSLFSNSCPGWERRNKKKLLPFQLLGCVFFCSTGTNKQHWKFIRARFHPSVCFLLSIILLSLRCFIPSTAEKKTLILFPVPKYSWSVSSVICWTSSEFRFNKLIHFTFYSATPVEKGKNKYENTDEPPTPV